MIILALDQLVSCRSSVFSVGFSRPGTQIYVFRNILNNKTLQQPETGFPALGFFEDYLSRNNCHFVNVYMNLF